MSQDISETPLLKRSVCEGLGTGLLVAAVVGWGIMGERLAGNLGFRLAKRTQPSIEGRPRLDSDSGAGCGGGHFLLVHVQQPVHLLNQGFKAMWIALPLGFGVQFTPASGFVGEGRVFVHPA